MITPEQFMAQPTDPDEDLAPDLASVPADPLTSIASSLGLLVSVVQRRDVQEAQADDQSALVNQLDREINALRAQLDTKQALIAQVLEVCKPSVSKLANQVREVLTPRAVVEVATQPPTELEVPADAPTNVAPSEPPPDGADTEEWRAYARNAGYRGPDVDQMNRSQIRTTLGIAHPEASTT